MGIIQKLLKKKKGISIQMLNGRQRDLIGLLVCDMRNTWDLVLSAGYPSLISLFHDVSGWDAVIALECN